MARDVKKQRKSAEIAREYGPFAEMGSVHGVTFDGQRVWFATEGRLHALAPETGDIERSIAVAADAGTAFDGQHLYQLAAGVIQKIDPGTGKVLATLPSPAGEGSAGLTWAEGSLWVAHYRERKIVQIDPHSGKILRTIASTKFVTGVTFVDGELWHATWEDDESEIRHVSLESAEVVETLELPRGVHVSGLESDGADLFYCGGAHTGKLRAVRRPKRP